MFHSQNVYASFTHNSEMREWINQLQYIHTMNWYIWTEMNKLGDQVETQRVKLPCETPAIWDTAECRLEPLLTASNPAAHDASSY